MLELALQLKEAIIRFAEDEERFSFAMTDEEWEVLSVLAGHLKIFYDATLKLSGSKYPTLNLFFAEFCEVHLAIRKMEGSPYSYVAEMGKKMLVKWDKYWDNGNILLALACIFDPRHKLAAVEYYLKLMYPDKYVHYVASFKSCLFELYKEYLQLEPPKSNPVLTKGGTSRTRASRFLFSYIV